MECDFVLIYTLHAGFFFFPVPIYSLVSKDIFGGGTKVALLKLGQDIGEPVLSAHLLSSDIFLHFIRCFLEP